MSNRKEHVSHRLFVLLIKLPLLIISDIRNSREPVEHTYLHTLVDISTKSF
jgi:hypothetical protein